MLHVGKFSSHMDPMGITVFPIGILLSPSTEFHGSPWISSIPMEKTAGYTRPLVTSLVSAVGLLEIQVTPGKVGKIPKKGWFS